jgi:hypothetical protein
MTEHATAVCRRDGCGKRFDLSHYSNRTTISDKTRKDRHRFCSPKCRVAHHRRVVALRGGVTAKSPKNDVTAPVGPMYLGGVTAPEISQQNQGSLPPKITTEDPYRGGIAGPGYAIRAEVIHARNWQEVVSSGGVVSYVSRLTARVLREG